MILCEVDKILFVMSSTCSLCHRRERQRDESIGIIVGGGFCRSAPPVVVAVDYGWPALRERGRVHVALGVSKKDSSFCFILLTLKFELGLTPLTGDGRGRYGSFFRGDVLGGEQKRETAPPTTTTSSSISSC